MSSEQLRKTNLDLIEKLNQTEKDFKEKLSWQNIEKPQIAIVLGSGLGSFCDELSDQIEVPYQDLVHMPLSAVPGHEGKWVYGKNKNGTPILAQKGRIHSYEGHDFNVVTFPIRLMARLGIKHVILTNATGCANPNYNPGEFVLIDDHINLMFRSPLHGIFEEQLGTRFVDLTEAYDLAINHQFEKTVEENRPDITLHRGIYAAVPGPNYETPAEVRMIHKLGGDVVGMSTVPETIVARQCEMKVNCISCVTNYGAGIGMAELSHEEVSAMGQARAPQFSWLVNQMIQVIISS